MLSQARASGSLGRICPSGSLCELNELIQASEGRANNLIFVRQMPILVSGGKSPLIWTTRRESFPYIITPTFYCEETPAQLAGGLYGRSDGNATSSRAWAGCHYADSRTHQQMKLSENPRDHARNFTFLGQWVYERGRSSMCLARKSALPGPNCHAEKPLPVSTGTVDQLESSTADRSAGRWQSKFFLR